MGLGKRGQDITLGWVIFHLIVLAIFLVFTIAVAFSIAQGTKVEQDFLARKIALLIGPLYAAPGNVDYMFDLPLINVYTLKKLTLTSAKLTSDVQFYYKLEKGKVEVFEKNQQKGSTYDYAEDTSFIKKTDFGHKLAFENYGNKVVFGKNYSLSNLKKQVKFQPVETKRDGKEIKVELGNPADNKILERILPRWKTDYQKTNYDIYIYVEFTSGSELKVYIPPDKALKSRKLASLILNEFVERNQNIGKVFTVFIGLNNEHANMNQANDAAVVLYIPKDFAQKPDVLKNAIDRYFAT